MGKPKNFANSQNCWMSSWRGSIEDRVTCPYNPNHVMAYHRLVLHIIPCAQKNPELASQYVTCPFNSVHRGPKEELDKHLEVCADKEMSLFTRVASGKKPYIEVYQESGTLIGTPPTKDKTPQMLQLETEWKEML